MIEVLPLTPGVLRSVYGEMGMEIAEPHALQLCEGGYALEDRRGVFAVGGICPLRPGVGMAWTVLTPRWKRYARRVTELCQHGIETSGLERIEAATVYGFKGGRDWLERMGFTMECERARKWDSRHDYSLFARVR